MFNLILKILIHIFKVKLNWAKYSYKFVFTFLVFPQLGKSSSQVLNKDDSIQGKLVPKIEYLEAGSSITFNCSLEKNFIDFDWSLIIETKNQNIPKSISLSPSFAQFSLTNISSGKLIVFCFSINSKNEKHLIDNHRITVYEKLKISRNMNCIVEHWQSMTCSWQLIDIEVPTNISLLWTLTGCRGKINLNVCVHQKDNICYWFNDHTLDHYRDGHYCFFLSVKNIYYNKTIKMNSVDTSGSRIVKPYKVKDVKIKKLASTYVILTWSQPDTYILLRKFHFYISYYITGTINDTIYTIETRNYTSMLSPLVPFTNYTVMISCQPLYSNQLTGFESDPEIAKFQTERDVPYCQPIVTPGNYFTEEQLDETNKYPNFKNIHLFWQTIPKVLQNGVLIAIRVRYWKFNKIDIHNIGSYNFFNQPDESIVETNLEIFNEGTNLMHYKIDNIERYKNISDFVAYPSHELFEQRHLFEKYFRTGENKITNSSFTHMDSITSFLNLEVSLNHSTNVDKFKKFNKSDYPLNESSKSFLNNIKWISTNIPINYYNSEPIITSQENKYSRTDNIENSSLFRENLTNVITSGNNNFLEELPKTEATTFENNWLQKINITTLPFNSMSFLYTINSNQNDTYQSATAPTNFFNSKSTLINSLFDKKVFVMEADDFYTEIIVEPQNSITLFKPLDENFDYLITLESINDFGINEKLKPSALVIPSVHRKPAKLKYFYVIPNELSPNLKWSINEFNDASYYTVHWCPLSFYKSRCQDNAPINWILVNSYENETVLSWLKIINRYRYGISVVKFDQDLNINISTGILWAECLHKSITEVLPPTNLRIRLTSTDNEITLAWDPPICEKTAFITHYLIELCKRKYCAYNNSGCCENIMSKKVDHPKTQTKFSNFESNSEYEFKIKSCSFEHVSVHTEEYIFSPHYSSRSILIENLLKFLLPVLVILVVLVFVIILWKFRNFLKKCREKLPISPPDFPVNRVHQSNEYNLSYITNLNRDENSRLILSPTKIITESTMLEINKNESNQEEKDQLLNIPNNVCINDENDKTASGCTDFLSTNLESSTMSEMTNFSLIADSSIYNNLQKKTIQSESNRATAHLP